MPVRNINHSRILRAPVMALLVFLVPCRQGDTAGTAPDMSARKALAVSIEHFMKWKSYRYRGTSSLEISGHPELNNKGTFDTRLRLNDEGAMDGHMVVIAPGRGSYEAYSHKRITYRKLEGGGWTKNSSGAGVRGAGMVSLAARRIIAAFADLVEDVRFVRATDGEYVVSCVMGARYDAGARRIAGTGAHTHGDAGAGNPPAPGTAMRVTIDRKTMELTRVWMKATQETGCEAGTVATITEGTYTEVNRPQRVEPPAEALDAPEAAY